MTTPVADEASSPAPPLAAEALEGRTVSEVRSGDTLRLAEWEAADPSLVCGITLATAGDFGVAEVAPEDVIRRYSRLGSELGFDRVSVPHQVHGADIVGASPGAVEDSAATAVRVALAGQVDGQVSTETGCLLVSTAADCVSCYLWERSRGVVGLVHAGWKGCAAGILPRAISLVRGAAEAQGSPRPQIRVHLGPAICGACYEVDEPVLSALSYPEARARLDLRGVLVQQAEAAGLERGAISVSSHCTSCGPAALHSHRASGGKAGRMAAFLGFRAP